MEKKWLRSSRPFIPNYLVHYPNFIHIIFCFLLFISQAETDDTEINGNKELPTQVDDNIKVIFKFYLI